MASVGLLRLIHLDVRAAQSRSRAAVGKQSPTQEDAKLGRQGLRAAAYKGLADKAEKYPGKEGWPLRATATRTTTCGIGSEGE